MLAFLQQRTVADVLESHCGRDRKNHFLQDGPVCLDAQLAVHDAALLLAERSISSAPVYDQATKSFIGLLDYHDFVAFVLTVFHKNRTPITLDANANFKDLLHQGLATGGGTTIKYISNLSHRNPMCIVQQDVNVAEAIQQMVQAKAHRLIVLEGDVFVGVLSATSIAEFVADHYGRFGKHREMAITHPWALGAKTLQELGLVQGKVISVMPEDPLLDALQQMSQHAISSVAIVRDGKLHGAISLSDVKAVFGPHGRWNHIYDSCSEFFSNLRLKQGIDNAGRDKVPLFTCTPDCTLVGAVEKMAGIRAHRLWILENADPSSSVVGVLSLSDILPLLVQ